MSEIATLTLARPSFWPEPGAPDGWLRALSTLAHAERDEKASIAGPWSAWENQLAPILPRRSVAGLFGLARQDGAQHLWGVGLIDADEEGRWRLGDVARDILNDRDAGRVGESLERLAAYSLGSSVWLRTLLIRLSHGDWRLQGWEELRRGRGQLLLGTHLVLDRFDIPENWWSGIEYPALGRWAGRLAGREERVSMKPVVDAEFSWSPLRAPLELLQALGWWSPERGLRLPPSIASDPLVESLQAGRGRPSQRLRSATLARADLRGLSPLEPVLRELAGASLKGAAYAHWADTLLSRAIDSGAIELDAAEPGQARHGRGLFGDRTRRLVRWEVHDEFDAIYESTPPPATPSDDRAPDREASRPDAEEDVPHAG